MLEIIKHTNKKQVECCSKFSDLFLNEYYIDIISYDEIKQLYKFNNSEIISRNIKNKDVLYYIIQHNSENIGYILLEKQIEILIISEFFILKRYRKKNFSKEVIKEIKEIASKNNLKRIEIFIAEKKKAVQKIFEKLGFIEQQKIAKYIGDDIYIFGNEYYMNI